MDGVPPASLIVEGSKVIDNKRAGERSKIRLTSDLPGGPYTVDLPRDAIVTIIAEPNDDV